jgi:hypothetical protein
VCLPSAEHRQHRGHLIILSPQPEVVRRPMQLVQ